ncbi:MAG TPA: helix-turn-helix transcriptional regulator [Bacteriovoracaceae bacterium]|nr:helix-turn-helix transcriptional regulator [Bacteriovoracaceae bacterium]
MKIQLNKDSTILIPLFFFFFSLLDMWWEYSQGQTLEHLGFELIVCSTSALWSLYLWKNWRQINEALVDEKNSYLQLNAEYQEWKKKNKKTITDMQMVIAEQFIKWELTPSEKDVAFLLLKGAAFKEIAEVRGSSEKTIRQHALKVYQKSGLPGRTELFAYFFEDLFLA